MVPDSYEKGVKRTTMFFIIYILYNIFSYIFFPVFSIFFQFCMNAAEVAQQEIPTSPSL